MSTAFSLMTSTLIVGWLVLGAHQTAQAAADVAMIPAHGGIPIRAVRFHQTAGKARPNVTLVANTAPREEAQAVRKVLDVEPTTNFSRLVGGLHDMLQGAGQSAWSTARLQGVLGHAFSFEMKTDGGGVLHDANLDWWLAFDMMPKLGYRIQRFNAVQRGKEGDFHALKADAWAAVRTSIDLGIPAVAWQPMSRQQKADGVLAYDWGLLVGYDESNETYTVRHQHVAEDFTVRYDAIGHSDPVEWFCVLVYDKPKPVDAEGVHVIALQNAVAFANGTRYDPEKAAYKVDARGFAAYELWRAALETEEGGPTRRPNRTGSQLHAGVLRAVRGHAATYVRELAAIFPEAASYLEEAAAYYDAEVATLGRLHDLCSRTRDAGGFEEDTRSEARDLVTAALQADRAAIARIEAALAVLAASQ